MDGDVYIFMLGGMVVVFTFFLCKGPRFTALYC